MKDDARYLYKRDDPDTSRLAAEEVTSNLGDRCRKALELVQARPGSTASELSPGFGGSTSGVAKRLSDLKRMGLAHVRDARTCRVTGRKAQTWYPGRPKSDSEVLRPPVRPDALFDYELPPDMSEG